MTADLFRLCHNLDQLVRQILRMRGHKPYSFQTIDLYHLTQELRESDRTRQILPVRIHVLSQQHDFFDSVIHQLTDLFQDLFRLPAALPPPYIRNDTITAEIIAAEHDIYTGLKRVFPFHRQVFHDLVGIFPDINDHPVRFQHSYQQFGKFKNIMGAKDQIYKRITFLQLLHHIRLLHHAAAESDLHMRIFLFVSMKHAQSAIDPQVGIFPDGTGIINDKVRILVLRLLVSCFFQDPQQFFRIPGVHLASESGNAAGQRTAQFPFFAGGQLSGPFQEIILPLRLLHRRGRRQIHHLDLLLHLRIYICSIHVS